MKPLEEDSPEQHHSVLQTKTGPQVHQVEPSISLAGRQVIAGRYSILGVLGRGGMGEVWHAFDLKLRVDVALKSLRSDRAQQDVETLRREVRTAREVISPNVCRIFDLVVEDQQEMVSMEYIDGITLAELLQKNGPLELQQAADIATQFLSGLQAIHQAGLVHRDFKPENVMITRTGRVVVMDFGIAKPVAQMSETISGTPLYMAPEQLEGRKLDPRSDLFAAGIVLAEMIAPQGTKTKESREALVKSMRQDPLPLPDHPWSKVIGRAVAKNSEDRFASAAAMIQALEEIVQRLEGDEGRTPYPGLNAFTESDAEFFFGRELEAESVLKKLQQLHLFAMIGPSGAGKTSLLQAGVIPALPEDWSFVFCMPGDTPFVNLAQALIPEFSGDDDAMRRMLRFEEQDTALEILRRWRQHHKEVLIIVDRFEELFTLTIPEVQSRFAELLGHAAVEADVRVLLAMRDDFLFYCHQYPELAPIFSDLTPLGPITGLELRRAIVEPALKCGYRFEDDALVEEILADVEKERGALPLMAFAASRLWEKRDRQSGTLTRKAYNEIGGVAGALAQHAESTMERIGADKHDIVREIFRNLITAQNTRAARDTEELLSVFSNRKDAEEVLRVLIDARLLTSFEIKQEGKRRVEIIHESLLSAWPRLVRWQTQDADSAQLRDQLRQAAQLWEERNRSEDLLWTGTAFLEFQAWQQRYPGNLSTTEKAFAQAMVHRATRRRRQRRISLTVIFTIVLGVAISLGLFWRQSEISRVKAETEAKRAEASKLLTLAQLHSDSYPTAALSYAMKSLELLDTTDARMFAMSMTQLAPPAFIMPANQKDGFEGKKLDFSPDGKWIAVGGFRGAQIRSMDGGDPILLDEFPTHGFLHCSVRFGPDRNLYTVIYSGDFRTYSIPAGKRLGRWKLASGYPWITRNSNGVFVVMQGENKQTIYFTDDPYTEPEQLGEIPTGSGALGLTLTDLLYTSVDYKKVYARSLKNWRAPERFIVECPEEILEIAVHPDGRQFAIIERSGKIRIFPNDPKSNRPHRTMESPGLGRLSYDPTGTRLVAFGMMNSRPTVHMWDLRGPTGTSPTVLTRSNIVESNIGFSFSDLSFHPSGKWLATAHLRDVAFWPLATDSPKTLIGQEYILMNVAFTPDGQSLLSASQSERLRSWPLSGDIEDETRIILRDDFVYPKICIHPRSRRFAVTASGGRVLISNLDGSEVRTFKGFSRDVELHAVAFSADGRLVAAAPWSGPEKDKVLRVWDVESAHVEFIGALAGAGEGFKGAVSDVAFIDNRRVLVSGRGGLQLFDLQKKKRNLLSEKTHGFMAISTDHSFVIVPQCEAEQGPCDYIRINLESNTTTVLEPFGQNQPVTVALDPTDQILVTGDKDGLIRVGKMSGGSPHVLFGHKGTVYSLSVSPDGRWIASGEFSDKIRLTPMPDLSKPAPHTLPYDQFLAKLKSFTNLRVVADPNSATGWKVEVDKFPGWKKVPEW